MSQIAIRQSGGASIISLPKAIVSTMGLTIGSKLDLTIKNNQIVLTPVEEALTLSSLLEGTSPSDYAINAEDKEWLNMIPVGLEKGID